MINDILDLSQITNGKLRLNPISFSPFEVVKDVTKLIKFQAKRKGLDFHLENKLPSYPNKPFMIINDPNRLKQVILNLLGNALKVTAQGSIRIIIEKNLPSGNYMSLNTMSSIKISVINL